MRATTREVNGAVFMLRCAQMGLHDDDLAGMTVGMVYDLLIEQANDNENYPYTGTQDDIRRIFG